MYLFFHNHGDLGGGYALVLVASAILDLSTYGGSHVAQRQRRDMARS
jgi:hypothetical protein